MEIKSVKNEKVEYKKISEITRKCGVNFRKAKNMSATAFFVGLLMQNKVLATTEVFPIDVMGGVLPVEETPFYYKILVILQWISILAILICVLNVVIKKVMFKKKGETYNVSKKLKITFIILIILMILFGQFDNILYMLL